MKSSVTQVILSLALLMLLAFSQMAVAQNIDTLDVAQGYETLNIAIKSDTVAGGTAKNVNRVYRLERGGYYLLNGELASIKANHLRIVAAKGDGPLPVLIPAVSETGAAGRCFRPGGDATFVGLYATGIDNLGNEAEKNLVRADGKKARIVIDKCFFDHDGQSFLRMNAEGQKYFITNTIMRNVYLLADPNNGRFYDTRGNTQDTIFTQNSTFYISSSDPMRSGDGIIKTFILDHCTFYQTAGSEGEFDVERAITCKVTNNLFVDFGIEGRPKTDSLKEVIIPIDTLRAPAMATEDQRVFIIKNNVYGLTPEMKTWIASVDSIEPYPLHDVRTLRFIATYPNMMSENNIEEYPVFSDPPDAKVMVAYVDYRAKTAFSDEGNPDPSADRNGRAALADNPLSAGPAPDEYDFDYQTTSKAYTHAEGNFPVGDLNWFPAKKTEWAKWIKTGVEFKNTETAPVDFALQQNYPNPFNPTTSIAYSLNTPAAVTLEIYNALGQRIRTVVDVRKQEAGLHQVQWDATDDSNRRVASGLYIYRLQVDQQIQTKKMLLMK